MCRLYALHLRGFSGVVPSSYCVQWVYETLQKACVRERASELTSAVLCRTFQSLLYLALHFMKKQTLRDKKKRLVYIQSVYEHFFFFLIDLMIREFLFITKVYGQKHVDKM